MESQLDIVVLWSPGANVRVAGILANPCLGLESSSREPGLDVTPGWMTKSQKDTLTCDLQPVLPLYCRIQSLLVVVYSVYSRMDMWLKENKKPGSVLDFILSSVVLL